MSLKKNNLGQSGKITWGHLGKRKDYTNEAFKVIETEKKKPYDWSRKLKPWNGIEKGQLVVMMPEKGVTPPPTGLLWNEVTTTWDSTTDNWESI